MNNHTQVPSIKGRKLCKRDAYAQVGKAVCDRMSTASMENNITVESVGRVAVEAFNRLKRRGQL